MAFILSVMGVVLIIEGVPYFAFPARVKQWAMMLQTIPDRTLRLLGVASMLTGLLLLSIVRYI